MMTTMMKRSKSVNVDVRGLKPTGPEGLNYLETDGDAWLHCSPEAKMKNDRMGTTVRSGRRPRDCGNCVAEKIQSVAESLVS